MTTITLPRATVEQALEALCCVRDMVAHPDNLEFIDRNVAALRSAIRAALARRAEPVERAMQDAVTTGMGIMRGGERIDPSTIYKPIEGVPV